MGLFILLVLEDNNALQGEFSRTIHRDKRVLTSRIKPTDTRKGLQAERGNGKQINRLRKSEKKI
jgi:hypothetical protein